MPYTYRPRGMPSRFMDGAPAIVQRNVLDMFRPKQAAPLEFDIVLRPEPDPQEIVGLDFGAYGERGCHFFLKPHEARGYRERGRRDRIAWRDLPAATQSAILAYLASD